MKSSFLIRHNNVGKDEADIITRSELVMDGGPNLAAAEF
jgi:hypothetical protein